MSDLPKWTDIAVAFAAVVAIFISLGSVLIAWRARNDAKQSAEEARRSRQIDQSALLKPHFDLLTKMTTFVTDFGGREPTGISGLKNDGIATIAALKDLLPSDKGLASAMDILVAEFENGIEQFNGAVTNKTSLGKPFVSQQAAEAIAVIKAKKTEYLKIG